MTVDGVNVCHNPDHHTASVIKGNVTEHYLIKFSEYPKCKMFIHIKKIQVKPRDTLYFYLGELKGSQCISLHGTTRNVSVYLDTNAMYH